MTFFLRTVLTGHTIASSTVLPLLESDMAQVEVGLRLGVPIRGFPMGGERICEGAFAIFAFLDWGGSVSLYLHAYARKVEAY
jgi:hypothetical protein